MPDIIRLFKGARNEFEVEVVFAEGGDQSPRESHTYDEILLVLEGTVNIELSNEEKGRSLKPLDLVKIPAGVEHVMTGNTKAKILVIHPDRTT